MVAPVSGPFSSTVNDYLSTTSRTRFRQAAPYNLPLPYTYTRYEGYDRQWNSEGVGYDSGKIKNTSFSFWSLPNAAQVYANAYNLAYENLQGQLGDTAGWAENFAQIGKSRQMFVERSVQAANFFGNMRRGMFHHAAKALRTPVPSRVSHKKALSQNILEFEYGLKPLISDLQSSLGVMTSDVHPRRIIGRSNDYIQVVTVNSGFGYFEKTVSKGKVGVRIYADVKILNPNLFLGQQLGLFDLALPWKLMPFSFIVDWFVNVEQVVSSLGDGFAVTMTNGHYSWKGESSTNRETRTEYQISGWNHSAGSSRHITAVEHSRTMGIPGPSLIVKPFRGFSIQRGIQAISLVLAVLGK